MYAVSGDLLKRFIWHELRIEKFKCWLRAVLILTDDPNLIVAHPDDFDNIVASATQAGLLVVSYDTLDDGWRYRIVYIIEDIVVEDYLMLSALTPPGEAYVMCMKNSVITPPVKMYNIGQ
jgi:hypothetical protein